MNRRMIFFTVGKLLALEGVLLLLPLAASLWYREHCVTAFLIAIAVAVVSGGALMLLSRPKNRVIFAGEGFAIVALTWAAVSAVGALPFYLSGEIPSYIDAFFETVSGFTTTGASIVPNVEVLSRGILFWRSFTHWVGGMGVLVLMMALFPADSGRFIHVMRAEMPGPIVGKLVPKIRDTAKILYQIYLAMTALQVVLLLIGGMPLFESLVHTFGTAGTGGFGVRADSIASYSPYLQWVITVFMLLFGVNFNLYYLILVRRDIRTAVRSSELWWYIAIVAASTCAITVNILPLFPRISDALRHAAFQVASIITTTGYATTDFNLWPALSKGILFVLMFIGGCAGSTAGGLKVSRVVLLWQTVRRDLRHMLHPRSVGVVRFEGKRVERETLDSLLSYVALYFLCLTGTFLLISLDGFDMETNISAAASCFNNVGPAFGIAGPAQNYAAYSPFSTVVLSFAMLLGRLEIVPLLLALSPSTWKKK